MHYVYQIEHHLSNTVVTDISPLDFTISNDFAEAHVTKTIKTEFYKNMFLYNLFLILLFLLLIFSQKY